MKISLDVAYALILPGSRQPRDTQYTANGVGRKRYNHKSMMKATGIAYNSAST